MGPDNADRAYWAEQAVDKHVELTGDAQAPRAQHIGDLMINLFHLCDDYALDADDMARHARAFYEAEIDEQGQLRPRAKRRTYAEATGLHREEEDEGIRVSGQQAGDNTNNGS